MLEEKRVLVTGGLGFIGSHCCKRLLELGYHITIADTVELPIKRNDPTSPLLKRGYQDVAKYLQSLYPGRVDFEKIDLRDQVALDALFAKYPNFIGVLHFAALCLVDESMQYPELYYDNNVNVTKNILNVMSKYHTDNLVFSSTCATYQSIDSENKTGVDEDCPQISSEEIFDISKLPTGVSPYGKSKKIAEDLILNQTLINSVIFRYFNVTGADSSGFIGDSKKPSQLLGQNVVREAERLSGNVSIVDRFELTFNPNINAGRGPIRDYIDVRDLVEAHILALEALNSKKLNGVEVFNLGTGKGSSVLDIVEAVEMEYSDIVIPRTYADKPRQGELEAIFANPSKAMQVLGWNIKHTFSDSVKAMRKWYKNHPNGWEK